MNHFVRSTQVYYSWLAMGDKQMKRMRVYTILFKQKEEGCCFALYRHCSPRVGFPCRSLGGATGLFQRCQYLSYRSTARYQEDEKRLLFSKEVGILKALQAKKIDSNPGQNCPNSEKVGEVFFFCFAQDQEIKHWVRCSFICYL